MVAKKLFLVAVLVSFGFLSFVFGLATMEFKSWPYQVFKDAYKGARAWYVKIMLLEPLKPGFRATHTKSGVFRYDQKRAENGLTLFTSGHAQKAFLINMEGQVVHEWHLPFSKVDWSPPHIPNPQSDDFIHWRNAYLYPNGDLLAIYVARDTPWGYGLVKMDRDSKMIWNYAERVHHDVDVGSDGKVYTLTHKIVTDKIPGIKLNPPLIEDNIVVLSPSGQEIKRLSISDAFRNSDFSNIFKLLEKHQNGDLWHANTVEVLDEQIADQFPFLHQGQILTSLREIDTIAVVDLEKEQVVWATRGPWHRQHDPDFLPNGNMLIFDNRGHYGKGGLSQVIEFDPKTMNIIWQYTGDEKDTFYSYARSAQQRLPNGNTLITESYNGRVFEVTPNQEVVWEFLTPFRSEDDNQLVASIHWAQRFHPDDLHFEFSKSNRSNQ